ncbi:hypothetical protein A2Y85_03725 [candidate division WOR-3 bacterium RBG_13_43_14]|uniref:DUF4221 domain-containing protein n=1 Tax=candidate division WOR-3 bacterium RBG_13_43_14 TaxID=1802590 RepID=A0A1F4U9C8_UNCW3|nr:MAG: hypothetical protein A2Y85_03725 [candidate division WOR-3 bacterium RBG_13_43_14]
MNKNIILCLSILYILSVISNCSRQEATQFYFPADNIVLKINTVSPDGHYMVIDFCYLSDSQPGAGEYYHPEMQLVLDMKQKEYWPLLDTTIFHDAQYFSWADDANMLIFSASVIRPKDTTELFPIYIHDLRTRTNRMLVKPWLKISHYSIPLFSHDKPEIIFWVPGVVVETMKPSARTVGRIFSWDTLQKTITKIAEDKKIATAMWMNLYIPVDLYMKADRNLWHVSLIKRQLINITPNMWVTGGIRRYKDKLVFPGMDQERQNMIYIYDMKTKSFVSKLRYNKGFILNASFNASNKLVVATLKEKSHWIFLLNEGGFVLDSLEGYTPFWLAGTDSLVCSKGTSIVQLYPEDTKLVIEPIFTVVKQTQ